MIVAAIRYGLRCAVARRGRWLPFVVVVSVGLTVVGTALGVADRASNQARDSAERDGAGRVVEVEGTLNTGRQVQLDASTLAAIERLPGVERVLPSSPAPLAFKDAKVLGALLVAGTIRTRRPPMVAPKGPPPRLRRGDVLLPARTQDSDLKSTLRRTIVFDTQRPTGVGQGTAGRYKLRVVGLYDPTFQADGQDVAYMTTYDNVRLAAQTNGLSPQEFQRRSGFDTAEIVVRRGASVDSVLSRVQRLGLPATTLSQRLTALPTLLSLGRDLGRLMAVVLLLIVALTTAGQTASAVRTRRSEIGVLRSVGYGRLPVMTAFTVEATAAALAAILLGIVGSLGLSAIAGYVLRNQLDQGAMLLPGLTLPAPEPLAVVVVATVVSTMLGAGAAAVRAARLDPSLALRPG